MEQDMTYYHDNSNNGSSGNPDHAYERNVRVDLVTALQVEKGIALQQTYGTHNAALFMHSVGVSVDVTMRVLLHPEQRRTYTVH